MITILFYLIIGIVSYPYMAKQDGIELKAKEWPFIVVAVVIWMIIWLPLMLYKIAGSKSGG